MIEVLEIDNLMLSCRRFDWMHQSSSRRDEPGLGETLHFIGYLRGQSDDEARHLLASQRLAVELIDLTGCG